jgi:hypothetical protein
MGGTGRRGGCSASRRAAAHAVPERRVRIPSRSEDGGSSARARARSRNGTTGSTRRRAGRSSLRADLPRPAGRALPDDPRECVRQIGQQSLERTCQDRRPRHNDVVISRLGGTGKESACRGPKAPARAVAGHGVADPPAGGEADADLPGRAARLRLQNERRRRPAAARPRHGEELAAPLEPDHSDLRGRAYAQAEPVAVWRRSAGQALAPFRTSPREHATAADGRHARAEAVPPLADDVARLICAFHDGAFRQPLAKPKRRV